MAIGMFLSPKIWSNSMATMSSVMLSICSMPLAEAGALELAQDVGGAGLDQGRRQRQVAAGHHAHVAVLNARQRAEQLGSLQHTDRCRRGAEAGPPAMIGGKPGT